jgi:hypothetical protein
VPPFGLCRGRRRNAEPGVVPAGASGFAEAWAVAKAMADKTAGKIAD